MSRLSQVYLLSVADSSGTSSGLCIIVFFKLFVSTGVGSLLVAGPGVAEVRATFVNEIIVSKARTDPADPAAMQQGLYIRENQVLTCVPKVYQNGTKILSNRVPNFEESADLTASTFSVQLKCKKLKIPKAPRRGEKYRCFGVFSWMCCVRQSRPPGGRGRMSFRLCRMQSTSVAGPVKSLNFDGSVFRFRLNRASCLEFTIFVVRS